MERSGTMDKKAKEDQLMYERLFWEDYNEYIQALQNWRIDTAGKKCWSLEYWAKQMTEKKKKANYLMMARYCSAQRAVFSCARTYDVDDRKEISKLSFRRFARQMESMLGYNPCQQLIRILCMCEGEFDKALELHKAGARYFPAHFRQQMQTLLKLKKAAVREGNDVYAAYDEMRELVARSYVQSVSDSNALSTLPLAMVMYHSLCYDCSNGHGEEYKLEYIRLAIRFKKLVKEAYIRLNGSAYQAKEELGAVTESPGLVFVGRKKPSEYEKLAKEYESI